jgi:hypothetical protein
MLVHNLQKIVLSALRDHAAHVLKTTIYSLSDEPDDPQVSRATVDVPTVVVEVLMTRDQFFTMRGELADKGIRVNYRWQAVKGDEKTFYEIAARPRTV